MNLKYNFYLGPGHEESPRSSSSANPEDEYDLVLNLSKRPEGEEEPMEDRIGKEGPEREEERMEERKEKVEDEKMEEEEEKEEEIEEEVKTDEGRSSDKCSSDKLSNLIRSNVKHSSHMPSSDKRSSHMRNTVKWSEVNEGCGYCNGSECCGSNGSDDTAASEQHVGRMNKYGGGGNDLAIIEENCVGNKESGGGGRGELLDKEHDFNLKDGECEVARGNNFRSMDHWNRRIAGWCAIDIGAFQNNLYLTIY